MSVCYPIIINRTHYEGGSTFRYRFGTSVDMGSLDIALGSASLFYSWPNITSLQNNNSFRIVHPTSSGSVTLNVTVPDGGYEISDLNNYIRWLLISQGYFITNNNTGEQTVYGELRTNASTYSVEWVSYPVPTSLPSGFTAGSALTFPTTARGPQLVVLNNEFTKVIGFTAGSYPATQQASITTSSSSSTPILSQVSSVLITLDSASNPFAPNSKVIHSMSPAGVSYGRLIADSPNELSFVPQQQGFRQELTIQLTNQLLQPLNMLDPDVTIKLLLRSKNVM